MTGAFGYSSNILEINLGNATENHNASETPWYMYDVNDCVKYFVM